jgi:hypothetical protein
MATIHTTEPATITAGDSITWTRSLGDYPAGTWTLKYRLINATGKIDITATASGTTHLVAVAIAVSAVYVAGTYAWTAWVEKTGERVTVGSGTMVVKPDLAVLTTFDARSDAALIVDQLTLAYKAYTASSGHVSEYQIAGRVMKYRSSAEILDQLNHWRSVLLTEKRAERIAAGLGGGNKILVRF